MSAQTTEEACDYPDCACRPLMVSLIEQRMVLLLARAGHRMTANKVPGGAACCNDDILH